MKAHPIDDQAVYETTFQHVCPHAILMLDQGGVDSTRLWAGTLRKVQLPFKQPLPWVPTPYSSRCPKDTCHAARFPYGSNEIYQLLHQHIHSIKTFNQETISSICSQSQDKHGGKRPGPCLPKKPSHQAHLCCTTNAFIVII